MNNYSYNNTKNNSYNKYKKPLTPLEQLLAEDAKRTREIDQSRRQTNFRGQKLIEDTSVYAVGELAELLVAQYFRKKNFEVFDLSKVKEAQKLDIDLAIRKGEIIRKIEVKYDSYTARTNAICLELRNLTRNVKSWFYTSGATELVVVPQGKEYIGYMFSFKDLRKVEQLFDLKKQKDPISGCWFEIGIVSISDLQSAGVTVTTLMLPKSSEIMIEGYDYDYIEQVKTLQTCFEDEEITSRYGYEIPKFLKRGEM